MADGSAMPALITAVGGVVVSLTAIYAQGKKVDKSDVKCQAKLDAVTEQMTELAAEVSDLRKENVELKVKVAICDGRHGL